MSDLFERLNRETREASKYCTPPSLSTPTMRGTERTYSQRWQDRYNNQTFKANNGQYSRHYY